MMWGSLLGLSLWALSATTRGAEPPDLILHHGHIVTVDGNFSIQEAIAIQGEQITAVGSNDMILKLAGPETKRIDLAGQTVLPGLIDSHVHPTGAATYEFDHPIPAMESIADVLSYVQARAEVLEDGEWILTSQIFITRLRDQRFPNRRELDLVAPNNPVCFRTGPDAALNSLALQLNGIDKDFREPEGMTGKVERDPETGEPTGIIRSAGQFIKTKSSGRSPSREDRLNQLQELFADYNSVGITSISDRNASDGSLDLYAALLKDDKLTCRLFLYYGISGGASLEETEQRILKARNSEWHAYNNRLWLRGAKFFLDGGMLTGSAFMKKPWGVSEIYGISDPAYRGVRNVEPEKVYEVCKLALANEFQVTAHAVGDGAVETLVDTYARIDRDDFPVRDLRPCVTHCNFMSAEAIDTMARVGIVADLQPAWLWLDGRTLTRQFGEDRLQWFQPYRTLFEKQVMVGGGSDHMQRIGSLRSVNPYNPFLGMWITLTRQPRWTESALHPEQCITREQAIRLYTINNAWLTFEEQHKGSLEPGKLADLIVLDRDILTCPVDKVRDIQVRQTYLGGKVVFSRKAE